MTRKILFSLLSVSLLFGSCSGNKAIPAGILSITFGSGGGFTGTSESFVLTPDHKLSKNGQFLKEVTAAQTAMLFNDAHKLKVFSYNNPGNLYNFIEVKSNEKSNRIVWAPKSAEIDPNVVQLYQNLIAVTK